jgi:hypothetical protein
MFGAIKKGLGSLWNSAKAIGIGGLFHTARNWTSGFMSAPGKYNYCGPGNSLANGEPTNGSDAGCRQHDMDYSNFARERRKGNLSDVEARQLTRESDQRLISHLQGQSDRDIGSYASEYGIRAKNALEDIGLLNPLKFVVE